MLHIYVLRCSSFVQVQCNWYRMGTIASVAKSSNCKTALLEATSRLILRENCTSNPITNL